MYKVKLFPSKCPKKNSWVQKHKDGDVKEVSNNVFDWHKSHNCMKVIEHYKMVTTEKYKCKHCGSKVIKREKVIIK